MLTIIFGTRPEYLKIKPLIFKLKSLCINFSLIYICQHEHIDIDLDDYPIINIKLKQNDIMTRLCFLSTEIMSNLDTILDNTLYLLVQGDTATSFFSALSAFHKKIPIFHLEAGLRTYDLENPFPEEGYRSMISRIATYHLCPDIGACNNLNKENISSEIYCIGNTINDLIVSYNLSPILGDEVIITIHRRENWDLIISILKEINKIATLMNHLQFTWILHPNPSIHLQIQEYKKINSIANNLLFSEPLNHLEMARRISKSYFIITDSGGIQEEASFLGKHSYVIRKITERNTIPPEYITLVPDIYNLYSIIKNNRIQELPPCHVYGNGTTSEQFVKIYTQVLNNKN